MPGPSSFFFLVDKGLPLFPARKGMDYLLCAVLLIFILFGKEETIYVVLEIFVVIICVINKIWKILVINDIWNFVHYFFTSILPHMFFTW